MSLHCRIFGHDAAPGPVWNNGRHFSTCKRCSVDLVRGRGMVWRPAPPGMTVVWKARDEVVVDGVSSAEDEFGGGAAATVESPAEAERFLLRSVETVTPVYAETRAPERRVSHS